MYGHFDLRGSSVYADMGTDIAFSARRLKLWDPTGTAQPIYIDGAATQKVCSIAGEGFPPYSVAHMYYMGGANVPLIMRPAAAPPPIGPDLTDGYTHYCHAGVGRLNARAKLNRLEIRETRHAWQNNAFWPVFVQDPSNPLWPQVSITPKPSTLSVIHNPANALVGLLLSASQIKMYRASDDSFWTVNNPPTVEARINAGPYAGYRDQAEPFLENDVLHPYWIHGPLGFFGCTSKRPPDIGPNLPIFNQGFDRWAYAHVSTKILTAYQLPNPLVVPYVDQSLGAWHPINLEKAVPDFVTGVAFFMDPQLQSVDTAQIVPGTTGMVQSAFYLSLKPDPAQFDAVFSIYSCAVPHGGNSSFGAQNGREYIPAPEIEADGSMRMYGRWSDITTGAGVGNIRNRMGCIYGRGYDVPRPMS